MSENSEGPIPEASPTTLADRFLKQPLHQLNEVGERQNVLITHILTDPGITQLTSRIAAGYAAAAGAIATVGISKGAMEPLSNLHDMSVAHAPYLDMITSSSFGELLARSGALALSTIATWGLGQYARRGDRVEQ